MNEIDTMLASPEFTKLLDLETKLNTGLKVLASLFPDRPGIRIAFHAKIDRERAALQRTIKGMVKE